MTQLHSEMIAGLETLAARYDLFICDLWGVLHNGEKPYPHVLDCLNHLAENNKQVVFLSNAPRPNETVKPKLIELGFNLDQIQGVITSGDATVQRLKTKKDGTKPFHIGPERDLALFEFSGREPVKEEDADFILCSGLFDDTSEIPDDYTDLLARLLERNLPMVCANPDIRVIRGNGYIYCGGAIAKTYEEMGGTLIYCGKPDPSIFQYTLSQANVATEQTLMIGDGAFTDILGANRAGLDSLFIAGGLHRDVLGLDKGTDGPDLQKGINQFLVNNNVSSTWWMSGLKW